MFFAQMLVNGVDNKDISSWEYFEEMINDRISSSMTIGRILYVHVIKFYDSSFAFDFHSELIMMWWCSG